MDLTIFELDIDVSTINTPFSGDTVHRTPAESVPTEDESGRLGWVLVLCGGLLAVGGLLFAVIRSRPWRDDGPTDDPVPTTDAAAVSTERDGLRALVGLGCLLGITIVCRNGGVRSSDDRTTQ